MTSDRWADVERLYHAAMARPARERAAFLAETCAGDEALRHEVESLLAQGASADGLVTRGAVAAVAGLVSDVGRSVLTGRRLGAYQISTDGGSLPIWSRDGRELFFTSFDRREMLAAPVQSGTTLAIARPHVLFEFPIDDLLAGRPYDVAPDGRFLIISNRQREASGGTASNLILV